MASFQFSVCLSPSHMLPSIFNKYLFPNRYLTFIRTRKLPSGTYYFVGEIYTPEDAINRAGFGKFQVKLTMLSGFVWVSISCNYHILECYCYIKKIAIQKKNLIDVSNK